MFLRYQDIILKYKRVPKLGKTMSKIRPFKMTEKDLKEFGKSASSTPLTVISCLASVVYWFKEAINLIPCQAALRSPLLIY